jgi:hypothetical protein
LQLKASKFHPYISSGRRAAARIGEARRIAPTLAKLPELQRAC